MHSKFSVGYNSLLYLIILILKRSPIFSDMFKLTSVGLRQAPIYYLRISLSSGIIRCYMFTFYLLHSALVGQSFRESWFILMRHKYGLYMSSVYCGIFLLSHFSCLKTYMEAYTHILYYSIKIYPDISIQEPLDENERGE